MPKGGLDSNNPTLPCTNRLVSPQAGEDSAPPLSSYPDSPAPSVPGLEVLKHTTGAQVAERVRVQRVLCQGAVGGKKPLHFSEEMKPGLETSALPARENKHS